MQPAKLGAVHGCLLAGAVLAFGLQAPSAHAQSPVETQQQANERIRALSANTFTAPREYIIGRGDLIGVEVYDVPELTRELRVSQTGTIGLPLVPVRIYAVGPTETKAQQNISESLAAEGMVSEPKVL